MKDVKQVWTRNTQRMYSNEPLSFTPETWHYVIKQCVAAYTHQLWKLKTFLLSEKL